VRPGVAEDAPALAALFLAARREAMPWLPVPHDAAATRRWMAAVVLVETSVLVAPGQDGAPAGFAAWQAGWLDHLYVAPAAQGRGLGTALLRAAQAANPEGLRLHVFRRNAGARRFYHRHGFRLVTLRDGRENEEGEPDALYAWP